MIKTFDLGNVKIHWLDSRSDIGTPTLSTVDQEAYARYGSKVRADEFLRGRYLIQKLLPTDVSIERGPHGNIMWPKGWTGSLSHKNSEVIATAYRTTVHQSVGIDLELVSRVHNGIAAKICVTSDFELLNALPKSEYERGLAAIFSLKEALFKCRFPLNETMFYFHDAYIEKWDYQHGTATLNSFSQQTKGCFSFKETNGGQYVVAYCYLPGDDEQTFNGKSKME